MKTPEWPLVYQMGKVGSVTVQVALRSKGLHSLHAHYLVSDGEFNTPKPTLLREIRENKDRKWQIITLVRDPIARNLSAFFRDLATYWPHFRKTGYSPDMVDVFIKEYNQEWVFNWFDNELKPLFGVDVYSSKFPTDIGWTIYEKNNVEVLLIRTEDLSTAGSKALKVFTGVKGMKVPNSNKSIDTHVTGVIYEEFLQKATLPLDYVNRMYDTRLAKHFYSEEELKEFTKRWCK